MLEHPLFDFLGYRPGLCLYMCCSALGWGLRMDTQKTMNLCQRFTFGLYLILFLFWLPGFFQAWSTFSAVAITSPGCFFFIRSLKRPALQWPQWSWWQWVGLSFVGLWAAIAFVRSSAPPYFIDSLQYQLPLTYQFFYTGGFPEGNDFLFGHLTSTGVHESLGALFMFLKGDEATVVLFNVILFCMTVHGCMGHNFKSSLSAWMIFFLLISCGSLFHSMVYGKTELLMCCSLVAATTYITTNWRLSLISPSVALFIGCFFSFCCSTKLSAALPALVCLLFFLVRLYHDRPPWKDIFFYGIGASIPACLIIIKNSITIGMPLFPFFIHPDLVPHVLQAGVQAWASTSESADFTERLSIGFSQIMGMSSHRHFPTGLWLPSLICLAFWSAFKKKWTFPILLAFAFLNWGYWLLTYLFPTSTLRIHLPFFLCAIPFLIPLFDELRHKINIIVMMGLCLMTLHLFSSEAKMLPGLRVHLGQQSIATFQVNLGNHVAAFQHHLHHIPETEKVAVCSEMAGVLRGRAFHYVNLSAHLQKYNTLRVDTLVAWMQEHQLQYFLIQGQTYAPEIYGALLKGIEQKQFEVALEIRDHLLVKLKT